VSVCAEAATGASTLMRRRMTARGPSGGLPGVGGFEARLDADNFTHPQIQRRFAVTLAARQKRLSSRNKYMLHYSCFSNGIRARAAAPATHAGVPEKGQKYRVPSTKKYTPPLHPNSPATGGKTRDGEQEFSYFKRRKGRPDGGPGCPSGASFLLSGVR
jgi:hypothetical protein